jgi:DNA-binding response OmpR family regulator
LSPHSAHIVIVDDDPQIRMVLRRAFEPEGYRVSEAAGSVDLFVLLRSQGVDLVTLDLTLRNEDGLDVARRVRAESRVPIIMVTGKGDTIDRVVGLELGADDYIAKPFHVREVLARVKTVLRRAVPEDNAVRRSSMGAGSVLQFAGWQLDLAKRELRSPDGGLRPLTTAEFDLLSVFAKRPNHVLSRDVLMETLKGHNWAANDRAIDTQVARLRRKLVAEGEETELIKTVRGAGYSFTADVI